MGNVFLKNPTHEFNDPDLNKSLLLDNLVERITYLEDKIDVMDAHLWKLESYTQANLKVLSADITRLHSKIKK
jgi:hypothetical protein